MRVAEAEAVAETDLVERALDAPLAVGDTVDGQRFLQQAVDGLARVQRPVRVLEDHLHLAVEGLVAAAAQCPAINGDAAGGDRSEACDRPQQRRLAGAGLPDQAEGFTRLHLEADALQGAEAVENHLKTVYRERRRHAAHSGLRSSTGSGWRSASILGMQSSRPRV